MTDSKKKGRSIKKGVNSMETSLYDQLDDAQAKLIMLRDTAEAVYTGDMAKEISNIWFGGTCLILGEINSVLNDVLNLCEKPLKDIPVQLRIMTSGATTGKDETPEAPNE